jgi:hypothetical protein
VRLRPLEERDVMNTTDTTVTDKPAQEKTRKLYRIDIDSLVPGTLPLVAKELQNRFPFDLDFEATLEVTLEGTEEENEQVWQWITDGYYSATGKNS